VQLPLERDQGRPALRRPLDEPEVSVILPMPDHRGYAERAVTSWTEGQTFARDRYEVIVASDGADAALDERVEPLLGPADRAIREDGATEIELYDKAARAARGRLLVFTEPHCIAEPDFIEEMVAHLARTGEPKHADAPWRSARRPGAMEQVLYDEASTSGRSRATGAG
jgi:hypothetical protein